MSGRKHTIRAHPRLEEIKNKIISGSVVYRQIAEEYDVSLSAVKRYAAEIKNEPRNNEPRNRDIPGHFAESNRTPRTEEVERQRLEAEADLREKQRQDPRAEGPAELQQPESEKKLIEYHEGEIQYIPTVRLASDPDFKPGFQPEWRQRQLEMEDEIEYQERRNRFYANPWNWRRPFRDNL